MRFRSSPPSVPRALGAALGLLVLGLGGVTLLVDGWAADPLLRFLQSLCMFGLGTLGLLAGVGFAIVRLGGWREADGDFEALVERSERLARGDVAHPAADARLDPPEFGVVEFDTYGDLDGFDPPEIDSDPAFDALVRDAIDELPIEFHRALEHVAIIVSDSGSVALPGRNGRRRAAYGLYQGDTVAHDYFTERIFIFRDTLERDFGHDSELLRRHVRRVLRHELAHHLGWSERGVRKLGL